MARYGKKAQEKVERAMHERKRGTLRSGGSGKKVKSREQAIAIGLSEAREEGGKVPRKKSSRGRTSARKSTSKRATAKTSSSRRSARKSTTSRRSAGRSSAKRKSPARKR